jgi:hypothetical protein
MREKEAKHHIVSSQWKTRKENCQRKLKEEKCVVEIGLLIKTFSSCFIRDILFVYYGLSKHSENLGDF